MRRCTAPRGSPGHRLPRQRRTARSRWVPDETRDHRHQTVDHYRDAALIRVESVRLIELGFHCNTFKKEWIKLHTVDLRKFRKDPIKGSLVLRSPIRRREHADEQHLGTASLDLSDHLVEIIVNRDRVDAAQRI